MCRKKAVLCAPRFDDATKYTYEWSRDAAEYLKAASFSVVDLSGRMIRRGELERELPDACIYVHYDHGDKDCHYGGTEKLITTENVSLLAGKEVYCVNCLSASKLGVEAWKVGATYWGYKDVFMFTTDAIPEFKEFANLGLKLRLEGKSWREALREVKSRARQLILKLISEGKWIASSALRHNLDALVCYEPGAPPTESRLKKCLSKIFGMAVFSVNLKREASLGALLAFGVTLISIGVSAAERGDLLAGAAAAGVGALVLVAAYLLFKAGLIEELRKLGLASKADARSNKREG